ncbi:MAG: biopolymer transporter ExbD [Proteobacteria bacterium]|nr:biopolymer transporter ExbD [Pseudomonadota bacterium]NDC23535.1 biopolymer transporter ExbD [Pseudomonadota bacterium]NDD04560.1 biopolymer transporter ExbD [Pseudomonadota bacterium]
MAVKISDSDDESIVAEINITPLTDIFLVLLIIFMISSSAMLEGGLNVKLPSAKSGSLTKNATGTPLYISINKEGQILVDKQAADESALTESIKAALANSSEKTVIIRGDESIFLGKAVKIMDAARDAGAEKIAIATQPSK